MLNHQLNMHLYIQVWTHHTGHTIKKKIKKKNVFEWINSEWIAILQHLRTECMYNNNICDKVFITDLFMLSKLFIRAENCVYAILAVIRNNLFYRPYNVINTLFSYVQSNDKDEVFRLHLNYSKKSQFYKFLRDKYPNWNPPEKKKLYTRYYIAMPRIYRSSFTLQAYIIIIIIIV